MDRCASLMLAGVVLGCQLPNPAFDDDRDSGSEGSTGEVVDTGEPLETSDTGELTTTDTGEDQICEFKKRPALRLELRTGDGICPPFLNELALSLDTASVNAEPGMVTGNRCDDFDCASCPHTGYAIGAPGFAGLAQTWTVLAEVASQNGSERLCVEATVANYVDTFDGVCIYDAMGIYDNTIEGAPIFVGQVGDAPATWVATDVLGQELPVRSVDPIASCSCMSVFAADLDTFGCCQGADLEPSFYSLELRGLALGPGQSMPLLIGMVPWVFHVAQAQIVPTCDNTTGKEERSWALTRQE